MTGWTWVKEEKGAIGSESNEMRMGFFCTSCLPVMLKKEVRRQTHLLLPKKQVATKGNVSANH